ncbi:OmpA family protein [Flavobacterium nackdongense]|uniref:OmpA family protein n=1 Tax=Flavobacterium nackdongense TaxID=2547394 RepID=A0A4P6Y8Q0_9FLAO|nr:OmpA family protein [Flavobacterium nackdongense]QBN19216.1 OmpA family protein [Flavobacterium nackdongense]
MNSRLQILILLCFGFLSAQENSVQSVYFEFDKYTLAPNNLAPITAIINTKDFSKYEAIQLYGYCDDRGTIDYNDKLSKKRVDFVQQFLMSKGISQNKIYICEGRGKVDLDKNSEKNIKEFRDKNRRVDLIFVKKIFYTAFPENPKVGDNIVLERIIFDMGSSELSSTAKKELDKTVLILKKHKTVRFEIKGHVCCTSAKYKDAIDNETQNRDLSENRAKKVFLYFRSKGINPYRMSYKGYGNQFPLGLEDAQDRRVELFITRL